MTRAGPRSGAGGEWGMGWVWLVNIVIVVPTLWYLLPDTHTAVLQCLATAKLSTQREFKAVACLASPLGIGISDTLKPEVPRGYLVPTCTYLARQEQEEDIATRRPPGPTTSTRTPVPCMCAVCGPR